MLIFFKASKSPMMTGRISKTHALLLLQLYPLLLLLFNFVQEAATLTHPQDVDALVALHTAWFGNPSSWDTSTDPCDDRWLGIKCNTDHTRVARMFLINQALAGTLSPAIGNLTQLVHLDVSSNPSLGGSLPVEIGKLAKLQRFFVQFCHLSGTIPFEIGNMTSLKYFGLTENFFTGFLPPTIGFLEKIIWLDVSQNGLYGPLPDSSSSGIGSGLDNLTKAIHFHLQHNHFSGSIPASIFNTEMRLLHLLLDENHFSGDVPPSISNLLHAEIICLDSNSLNGTIPSTISTIVNLTTLQLDENQFSGQIPDLSNNKNLQILTVSDNPFQASTIPSWITNMTNLYQLSMDSTNLIGKIPIEIFGFSPHLSNVSFASNRLNGTLNLTSANSVLLVLNLTDNLITNVVDGNYTQDLILDGNPYCSSAPTICTPPMEPSEAPTALPPTAAEARVCSRDCSSGYKINPKLVGSCQCARPVVTECGFYAIKVPFLTEDNALDMESGFMIGLTNSDFLEGIPLQATQITVEIASSSEVNVLIFPPPDTQQWSSNDAATISYAFQNQEIQFPTIGPISCEFHENPYITVLLGKKLSKRAKIGIGFGVAGFLILASMTVLYAIKQRERAVIAETKKKPFAAWIAAGQDSARDVPQLRGARWFSLEEMRRCTNDFSDTNYIGKGAYGKVYIGLLASGDRVAVKRAETESHQDVAEFKNEIELLSRVHHKNLVALVGFCYEDGEQLLVYEYMPNGTLRANLTGEAGQLDWNRRMEIALDSARGIAYLHTEAHPPIIHRDIKSANILLDKNSVAKISDFGLSKLAIHEDGAAPISAQVAGSLEYLDPDYYLTSQLTEKSDVYSFGVVLLELVTGKLPIDGRGKHVVREVTMACEKSDMDLVVQSLVDPNLVEYPSKDLKQVLGLAQKCVDNDPAKRPSMVEVVKELEALVPIAPRKILPENEMDKLASTFYSKPLSYVQQSGDSGSSFENSESYPAIVRPLEPK